MKGRTFSEDFVESSRPSMGSRWGDRAIFTATMMEDSFRHKGMRKALIDSLRTKGIRDERVLEAMAEIPRHVFLDAAFVEQAYEDKALQIGCGQTISQPYTVAVQSSLLDAQPGMKVLEIGTGSGYQAAVLAKMGCKVYSIERQRELYIQAKDLLPEIGVNVKLHFGDGYKGLPHFAPFDRIIITCGASEVPQALVDQLKVGGIMVIPLGMSVQKMVRAEKLESGELDITTHGDFRFVPMLKNTQ